MTGNIEQNSDISVSIKLKSIFDPASIEDGVRIFVDRLWPRGLKKKEADVDLWLKDIAPSTELCKWLDQDLQYWDDFVSDYTFQLRRNKKTSTELISLIKACKTVSLLYSSSNNKLNNAVVLKFFLDKTIDV